MSTRDLSINPLSTRIEEVISPYIESGTVVGAVAAISDRETLLGEAALGFADRDTAKPMRPDSIFWIASSTKPLTATALMMLVDEGKLAIDDPIEKYLPEFEKLWVIEEQDETHKHLVKPQRSVTVRDILSHTSGMPFRSEVEQPTLDQLPLRIAVLSYAMTPLESQPGTKYAYSNIGINIGGRLIEVLSGMAYEQFMQERLFTPLGMHDTTFWPSGDQLVRLASAYTPNSDKSAMQKTTIGQLTYPLNQPTRYPMPGGGLFSTAADMLTFCRMILNGGVYQSKHYVSQSSIDQMTTRQTAPEMETSYGLGWGLGENSYGHGGALSNSMNIFPKLGRISMFLVQHAGFIGNGGECRGAFENVALEE